MANIAAARITEQNLSSGLTVASGQTITVFGIILTNSHTNAVTVQFTDGNDDNSFTMNAKECDSTPMDIPFIADKGLKVVAISGDNAEKVKVAVFHSQVGS